MTQIDPRLHHGRRTALIPVDNPGSVEIPVLPVHNGAIVPVESTRAEKRHGCAQAPRTDRERQRHPPQPGCREPGGCSPRILSAESTDHLSLRERMPFRCVDPLDERAKISSAQTLRAHAAAVRLLGGEHSTREVGRQGRWVPRHEESIHRLVTRLTSRCTTPRSSPLISNPPHWPGPGETGASAVHRQSLSGQLIWPGQEEPSA